jgi:hypothetical protein
MCRLRVLPPCLHPDEARLKEELGKIAPKGANQFLCFEKTDLPDSPVRGEIFVVQEAETAPGVARAR